MMTSLSVSCAVLLCLLDGIAASPHQRAKVNHTTLKQVMFRLQDLRNKTIPQNISSLLVAKMNIEKNLPVEELACRGLKSLVAIFNQGKKYAELESSLIQLSNNVNCTLDPEEQYDLKTALHELFQAFQYRHLQ